MTEITVTATRMEQAQALAFPPQPQFWPYEVDPDPWIMQPVPAQPAPLSPDVVVTPEALPEVMPEIAPAPPLTVPAPRPAIAPPLVFPFVSPEIRPGLAPQIQTSPLTSPQASPLPSTQPGVSAQPVPATRPITRTTTQARMQPLAQMQPALGGSGVCPPCRDEKETKEPRTECYKKLVKESFLPELDETYNWVEIDCFTGREL